MDLAFVVSGADVPFGHHHARIVHFQHDYGMDIIVYPQDIPGLYILESKSACGIHPCRQTAEGRIAEYKSKGYTAHGDNICTIEGTAFSTVVSF